MTRNSKCLAFTWRCYGEIDMVARLTFWIDMTCEPDDFRVISVIGILCTDVQFSDDRPKPQWEAWSQLCKQVGAVFKAAYRHDLLDVRELVYESAYDRFAAEMNTRLFIGHEV